MVTQKRVANKGEINMNLTEEEIGYIMASLIGDKFRLLRIVAQGEENENTTEPLGVVLMLLDKLKENISGVYAQNIALLHKQEEEKLKSETGMTSYDIFTSLASKYNNGSEFN